MQDSDATMTRVRTEHALLLLPLISSATIADLLLTTGNSLNVHLGKPFYRGLREGIRRRCGVFPLSAGVSDDLVEPRRVGFATSDPPEEKEVVAMQKKSRARVQTVNERLMTQINEQAKYLPKRTSRGDTKLFERRKEDLNGVNPLYAALGAAVAGSMSYGAWQATLWLAEAYARSPQVVSDILAVQRASGFMKQAVVGFVALASGIFGVTGLGMGLMAGAVTIGVLKGELDPSAKVVPRSPKTLKTPEARANMDEASSTA